MPTVGDFQLLTDGTDCRCSRKRPPATAWHPNIELACTLLGFAGIWALIQGVSDISQAFQIRSLERSG